MRIHLNGVLTDLPASVDTVATLFKHYSINETRVALEYNGQIVTPADYSTTALSDGDCLEIVTFVGGG